MIDREVASRGPGPTGSFAGFADADWARAWGVDLADRHNWGWDRMRAVTDPGRGAVLRVSYGPRAGGGQFYADLTAMGRSDLANAKILNLQYDLKFDAGFDFGRGGKLPGLYGGPPGFQSGGHHDGSAFSTRYMWRNHPSDGAGEVYYYSPESSGYGTDLGLGDWRWPADGHWHPVEQRVDRGAGTVTVWLDGRQALAAAGLGGLAGIPFAGILFSTFFGGSDDTWGPDHDEHVYFGNFTLSTGAERP